MLFRSYGQAARCKILILDLNPSKLESIERIKHVLRTDCAHIDLASLSELPSGRYAAPRVRSGTPVALTESQANGHAPTANSPFGPTPASKPMIFEYVDSQTEHAQPGSMLDFQRSRQIWGLLIIASAPSESDPIDLRSEHLAVRARYAHVDSARCCLVGKGAPTELPEGMIALPDAPDELASALRAVMSEMASSSLHDFAILSAQLEHRKLIETPTDSSARSGDVLARSISPEPLSPVGYTIPTASHSSAALNAFGHLGLRAKNSPKSSTASLPSGPPLRSSSAPVLAPGATVHDLSLSSNGINGIRPTSLADQSNDHASASMSAVPQAGRTSRRLPGRLAKIRADLKLMAGRWDEAQAGYNDAIVLAKNFSDHVWHASALEGLIALQIVQAWHSTISAPPMPVPKDLVALTKPQSKPFSAHDTLSLEMPDKMAEVLTLYAKSAPAQDAFPSDPLALTNETAHPLILAEAHLRVVELNHAVVLAGGWNARLVQELVFARGDLHASAATLAHTALKQTILDHLAFAYTPHLVRSDLLERHQLVMRVAELYGQYGRLRRQVLMLCEAACLAATICVQSPGTPVAHSLAAQGTAGLQRALVVLAVLAASGDKPSLLQQTGWPSLQVMMAKDAVNAARLLGDTEGMIRFATASLRHLSGTLAGEQYNLSVDFPEMVLAAAQAEPDKVLPYWGPPAPVVSASLDATPARKQLHAVKAKEAALGKLESMSDFIYTPTTNLRAEMNRPPYAVGDLITCSVVLQNPFAFPISIEDCQLVTAGNVNFEPYSITTTLASQSVSTVRLSGRPTSTGELVFTGCRFRLVGTSHETFPFDRSDRQLSTYSQVHEDYRVKRGSRISHARPPSLPVTGKVAALALTVVSELPTLALQSSSIRHNALMSFEGEASTVALTLINQSGRTVNFLKAIFHDNHTAAAYLALQTQELTPDRVYEIERDLVASPVLSQVSSADDFSIAPGESRAVSFNCLGKLGCTSASITLEYGHLATDAAAPSTTWVRRLTYDFDITVLGALQVERLTAKPLRRLDEPMLTHRRASSLTLRGRRASVDLSLDKHLNADEVDEHNVLLFEVRNTFSKPFEISIGRMHDGDFDRVREKIEPGATASIALRHRRMRIAEAALMRTIPSPLGRQFVVAKAPLEARAEQVALARFWRRQAFLDDCTATWREVGSRRQGTLSLRALGLDDRLLHMLAARPVDLRLSSDRPLLRDRACAVTSEADAFISIRGHIRNRSARSINAVAAIVLLPSADTHSEVTNQVLFDGPTTFDLAALQENEETSVETNVILLADGVFDFGLQLYQYDAEDWQAVIAAPEPLRVHCKSAG
ncbi:uncharacterized protein L969DRAFT_339417 [Mixia osmundae IAM 14324]|uniref:Uncharacterized protein n=1 Tax=Mixia osmundae (strain CBS 9802 / IAM 14324 / JCM 22182 / KY 12970) TaxID=764103 RepID=G7E630_MIXOS|nr:uncharacterized protein L969DRAFT_339417 [Mixia osmundae IAM 14324]KEI40558.1 hypothetical protein L969DRAFT_339417 [Mixia osmundae IAM 14324]GAA98290.1 hypothetical protein E5Q_04974 [Mixia osmundae IAM 14324]